MSFGFAYFALEIFVALGRGLASASKKKLVGSWPAFAQVSLLFLNEKKKRTDEKLNRNLLN